jgi:hypothetical protein
MTLDQAIAEVERMRLDLATAAPIQPEPAHKGE